MFVGKIAQRAEKRILAKCEVIVFISEVGFERCPRFQANLPARVRPRGLFSSFLAFIPSLQSSLAARTDVVDQIIGRTIVFVFSLLDLIRAYFDLVADFLDSKSADIFLLKQKAQRLANDFAGGIVEATGHFFIHQVFEFRRQ